MVMVVLVIEGRLHLVDEVHLDFPRLRSHDPTDHRVLRLPASQSLVVSNVEFRLAGLSEWSVAEHCRKGKLEG